jgi:hypothetical protein
MPVLLAPVSVTVPALALLLPLRVGSATSRSAAAALRPRRRPFQPPTTKNVAAAATAALPLPLPATTFEVSRGLPPPTTMTRADCRRQTSRVELSGRVDPIAAAQQLLCTQPEAQVRRELESGTRPAQGHGREGCVSVATARKPLAAGRTQPDVPPDATAGTNGEESVGGNVASAASALACADAVRPCAAGADAASGGRCAATIGALAASDGGGTHTYTDRVRADRPASRTFKRDPRARWHDELGGTPAPLQPPAPDVRPGPAKAAP